jgi:cyclic pyranopterin phosphate synthase
MTGLSHLDPEGRARMVDVGGKPVQRRTARALGRIVVNAETLALVRENRVRKGDVLTVAQIAGLSAAKRTAELIPLCHPLGLDQVDVALRLVEDGIEAEAVVRSQGRTGVEMEALTAVTVALLTVYDMCKSSDRGMRIVEVRLLEKTKEDA